MGKQFNRIKKRLNIISSEFGRDIKNFTLGITVINLIRNLMCLGPFGKINNCATNKRNKQIFDFLYKNNKEVFEKYRNCQDFGEKDGVNNIWICWLQGIENAPALVIKCIDSIVKNNPNCRVNIIDLSNYEEYVTINRTIVEKFQSGKIGAAHFSDVLRVNLIKEYGGLWLDATIFCTKKIPQEIFEYSFFSCKSPVIKGRYISNYQWTTFVFGGKKNSCFYQFMCDFYNSYWEKNDVAIDYLFADYTIRLASNCIPFISEQINNVPINNLLRDELQNRFDEPYDEQWYQNLISSDTYLFKLSWRMEFKEKTDEGKDTFYGCFIKG